MLHIKPCDVAVAYDKGTKGALVVARIRGKEPLVLLLSKAAVDKVSGELQFAVMQALIPCNPRKFK